MGGGEERHAREHACTFILIERGLGSRVYREMHDRAQMPLSRRRMWRLLLRSLMVVALVPIRRVIPSNGT